MDSRRWNLLTATAAASVTICIGLAAWADSHAGEIAPANPGLIVHEWGVMGVGKIGNRQVVGATDPYLTALPDFVFQNEVVAPSRFEKMELHNVWKPVVHFYGAEGQDVELNIRVGKGFPIVYFPMPDLTAGTRQVVNRKGLGGRIRQTQAMTWKFRLTKKRPPNLPAPPTGHWWQHARDIPSDYLVMSGANAAAERFIFYEGTTYQSPTIGATVDEDSITITNNHDAAGAPVIIIVNDKGNRSGVYLDSIPPGGETTVVARAKFKPWDDQTVFAQCRKQWEACGMTPGEAAGIVECWRDEVLNTPGFLLISRIPRPIYDTMFPLKMTPAPAELKRVCLVFDTLAGQDQRKHWLPELEKEGHATIVDFEHRDFITRLEARAKMIRYGEVMSPFVNEVLADDKVGPQLRMASSTLLRILTESQVCAPPLAEEVTYPGFHPGVLPRDVPIELGFEPPELPIGR